MKFLGVETVDNYREELTEGKVECADIPNIPTSATAPHDLSTCLDTLGAAHESVSFEL